MRTMLRLPDPLYLAVKPLFALHAGWHEAREPERHNLRGTGTEFPDLAAVGAPGSGEQFLRYHREMLAVFLEVSRIGGRDELACRPWREVPYWLSQFFSWAQPGYLSGALSRLREIVATGSPDELGKFLESAPSSESPFRGLHDVSHTMIAIYERHRFGADSPNLEDAGMGSPETAPHNEHFWGLHGWIDELYEKVARRHRS
jgi:hypothetical protein